MTRLVGVRAVCDGCSAAAAIVFCVSHRNVLCTDCDVSHHSASDTAHHQRTDLASAVTALPFCEYCDDAPATTYCETEGTTLCDKCDRLIHKVAEHAHWRTPIERTLRSRAVEFRPTSRQRSARQSATRSSQDKPEEKPATSGATDSSHSSDYPKNPVQKKLPERRAQPKPKPKPRHAPKPHRTPVVSPKPALPALLQSPPAPQLQRLHLKSPPAPKPPPPPPPSPMKPLGPATAHRHSHPKPIQPHPSTNMHHPALNQQTRPVTIHPSPVPTQTSTAPQASRQYPTHRRRPRSLAKRKHRRDHTRTPCTMPPARTSNSSLSAEMPTLAHPRPEILSGDDYHNFLYPHIMQSDHRAPHSANQPFSSFPGDITHAPPLIDPLLMDGDSSFRSSTDRDTFTSDAPMDFNNIIMHANLDLNDASHPVDSFSGGARNPCVPQSASASGMSSRRRTPEYDILSSDPRATNRTHSTPTPLAAAAAVAAGGMYLLNSASSGSVSTRERFSPPHSDMNQTLDPAGVAEAATAAAQSATAASVVDLEAIQAMGATKPSPFASEAFEDAVTGAGISRAATNSRISRRTSAEPTALPSQRPPSGTAALAQQRIFDEAVKKLEHTARVRGRLAPKSEDAFTDPMQDGRDRTEASSDIMTPMSYVGEDMLRRSDVMRDLEIPKDDFGVFDSIDLSPFDQNSSGALGYATPDYRGHSLELDDG